MVTVLFCNIKMFFSIPTHCKSYPFRWYPCSMVKYKYNNTMLPNFLRGIKRVLYKELLRNNKMEHHKKAQPCTQMTKHKSNSQSFNEHIQSYIICLTCFTFTTDSSYIMFNTKNKILKMEWPRQYTVMTTRMLHPC